MPASLSLDPLPSLLSLCLPEFEGRPARREEDAWVLGWLLRTYDYTANRSDATIRPESEVAHAAFNRMQESLAAWCWDQDAAHALRLLEDRNLCQLEADRMYHTYANPRPDLRGRRLQDVVAVHCWCFDWIAIVDALLGGVAGRQYTARGIVTRSKVWSDLSPEQWQAALRDAWRKYR